MFKEKTFNLPTLQGISAQTIEEHKKLYVGYVTNTNLILEKIKEYEAAGTTHAYAINEIRRRFSFEYDGMRNHEVYFSLLEEGPVALDADSPLKKAIEAQWGSFDAWLTHFKTVAMTRGVGWALLSYDPDTKQLLASWADEQHLGHLHGAHTIIALDMWEHSFMLDYPPSKKKEYIEAFFANLNWKAVEARFSAVA